MKITSIDVYDFGKCLNYEDCSPICIRINTDAGISGFGEVGLAYGNAHNAGVWMVKDFGQLIIGKALAERTSGVPKKPALGDRIVANVIYRDGTVIDTIKQVAD